MKVPSSGQPTRTSLAGHPVILTKPRRVSPEKTSRRFGLVGFATRRAEDVGGVSADLPAREIIDRDEAAAALERLAPAFTDQYRAGRRFAEICRRLGM